MDPLNPGAGTPAAPAADPVAATPTVPVSDAVQQPTPTVPAADPAATPAAPPVADPRAEINTLATQFGYSPEQFATFPDVASARAALRFNAEAMARSGLSSPLPAPGNHYPQYQQQQQPTYAPATPAPKLAPAAAALDLAAIGLDESDPAAKAIRALEARLTGKPDTTAALEARIVQMEQAGHEAHRQRLQAEAASVVDGFQSPAFGAGATRTVAQQLAVGQLYDLADAIAVGAFNSGRPIPSLAVRLNHARLVMEQDGSPSSAPAAAALPPLRQATPAPAPAPTHFDANERWADNPDIRRAVAGIL